MSTAKAGHYRKKLQRNKQLGRDRQKALDVLVPRALSKKGADVEKDGDDADNKRAVSDERGSDKEDEFARGMLVTTGQDDKRVHYCLQRDPRGRMVLRDDALILRCVFVTYSATNGVAFEEAAARIQDQGEANGCSWVNCEYEQEDPLKPARLPDAFYPLPVHHCLDLESDPGTLKVANQTKILVCCPEHALAKTFWMSCFDVEP